MQTIHNTAIKTLTKVWYSFHCVLCNLHIPLFPVKYQPARPGRGFKMLTALIISWTWCHITAHHVSGVSSNLHRKKSTVPFTFADSVSRRKKSAAHPDSPKKHILQSSKEIVITETMQTGSVYQGLPVKVFTRKLRCPLPNSCLWSIYIELAYEC